MKPYRKTKAIACTFTSLLGQTKNLRKNFPITASAAGLFIRYFTLTVKDILSLDLDDGSNPVALSSD